MALRLAAPPVYRPNQSAGTAQPKQSSAPPVYRPQPGNRLAEPPAVQPRTALRSAAPPVYRPNQSAGAAQPKQRSAPPIYRPNAGNIDPRVNSDAATRRPPSFPGQGAVQPRLPLPPLRAGSPNSSAIQPKVGFEFETSWELAATTRGSGVPNGANETALPVKVPLVKRDGWALTADFNKTKVAEFVTDPIEESDGFTLLMQMNTLRNVTSGMVAADGTAGRDGDWIKLKQNSTAELWIKKGDADMKAAPQMTAGVRLDRMIPLMKAMSKNRNLPGPQELLNKPTGEGAEKIARLMREATKRAEEYFASLSVPEKTAPGMNQFAGTIALLGLYALLGKEHGQLEYAKELSPLMARTNLGKLPASVRTHGKLGRGVMYVANIPEGDLDQKLFRQGFSDGSFGGPTFRAWITGIKRGDDPLRAFSGDQMSNLDRLEGVGPTTLNFDTFEEDFEAQGLIVELRGMQEGLPHDKWPTLAYHLREYIVHLNSSTDGGGYQTSNAYPTPVPAPVLVAPQTRVIPGMGSSTLRPVTTNIKSTYFDPSVERRIV